MRRTFVETQTASCRPGATRRTTRRAGNTVTYRSVSVINRLFMSYLECCWHTLLSSQMHEFKQAARRALCIIVLLRHCGATYVYYCRRVETDCKLYDDGRGYAGTASFTVSQRACQRWDSQTPHAHPYSDPGTSRRTTGVICVTMRVRVAI